MDWKTCLDEGNVIKITPNKKRAEFLLRQAEKTLEIIKKIELTDENASVFFVNYYDALLGLIHAMMYSNGYKVKNHYCLGYYLRDVVKDKESFRAFDRARLARNSIIYYGRDFDKDVAEEVANQIVSVFNKLKKQVK